MPKNKPKIYKKNGVPQRSDVTLNKEVATALTNTILSGNSIFSGSRYLELTLRDTEGAQKQVVISKSTIHDWITRNIVIPETGVTLRDLLDDARKEYRIRKEAEMDEKRKDAIDSKLNRVLAIRTTEPVVGMFGVIKDPTTGKTLRRENPKLLSEQMKNVRWLAERLSPERYGKVEKSVNKHLVFSLSDLRRYEEAQKSQEVKAQIIEQK